MIDGQNRTTTTNSVALMTAASAIMGMIACAGSGSTKPSEFWQAEIDTVGDTVVVHTVSGSVWGDTAELVPGVAIGVLEGPDEYIFGSIQSLAVGNSGSIYVFDQQVPAMRAYSADGEYMFDLGREGAGPGEFKQPDGLAVLPDGRVIVRDPGNVRITVYSPSGEFLEDWRHPGGGGFNTSRQFYVDTAGNSYPMVLMDREAQIIDWRYGLARISSTGEHTDTVAAPTWNYELPRVVARSENSSSSNRVPYNPDVTWTFSPLGYMVGGLSTDYRIDLFKPNQSVLRIERDWISVPVKREEKAERRRRITQNFKRRFPGWKWNGPSIPNTKPPFRGIFVDDGGRIWVTVSQKGRATMTAEEVRAAEELSGRPQLRFREPLGFDVFEPDGRFLGYVRVPDTFRESPQPVVRGDTVWAVTRDDLDVARVVRFDLTHHD